MISCVRELGSRTFVRIALKQITKFVLWSTLYVIITRHEYCLMVDSRSIDILGEVVICGCSEILRVGFSLLSKR